MTKMIDILSPLYIGEDRISLELDPTSQPAFVFRPITVNIDYGRTYPQGVGLPLEMIVQPAFGEGGKGGGFRRKVFCRVAPRSYTFSAAGAGQYLLCLREMGHNRWQGRLVIDVQGDEFSKVDTLERR